MQIRVNNQDLGYWTQSDITVQRFITEDELPVLAWCNHAGATQEREEVEFYRPEGQDISFEITVFVCNRCPAWRRFEDDSWEDAPHDGKY